MKPNFPEVLLLLIISFYATHLKDLKNILVLNKEMSRICMLNFVDVMKIMFTKEQIQAYPELLQYQQDHGCGIHFNTRIFYPLKPYENVKIFLKQAISDQKMSFFKRFIKDFNYINLIENIKATDPNVPEEDLEGFVREILYTSYMDSLNDPSISEIIEYVFDFKDVARKTIKDHFVDMNQLLFISDKLFCYDLFPLRALNDSELALYCKAELTWSEMFSSVKSFRIWRLKHILPYSQNSYYFLLKFSLKYPGKKKELMQIIEKERLKQVMRSAYAIILSTIFPTVLGLLFPLLFNTFNILSVTHNMIIFIFLRLFSPYFVDKNLDWSFEQ